MCVYVCVYVCVHTHKLTRTRVCVYVCVCVRVCVSEMAELIVVSPLRRTLQTAQAVYETMRSLNAAKSQKVPIWGVGCRVYGVGFRVLGLGQCTRLC